VIKWTKTNREICEKTESKKTNGKMVALFSDTSAEVEEIQLNLLRQTPTWRKIELVGQMNETMHTLALAGLKQLYPTAGPALRQRHLADLLLGPALAAQVYGLLPQPEESDGL
jgi:hypothetical protein